MNLTLSMQTMLALLGAIRHGKHVLSKQLLILIAGLQIKAEKIQVLAHTRQLEESEKIDVIETELDCGPQFNLLRLHSNKCLLS